MNIQIVKKAGADRNAVANAVRFIPGIGRERASRIADGHVVVIESTPATYERLAALDCIAVIEIGDAPMDQSTSLTPAPVAPAQDLDAEDAELINRILSRKGISEARVLELIQQHGGRPAHVTIDLRAPALEWSGEGLMHHKFPLLVAAVAARVNVMLVGPAGSGKTTAAVKCAKALGLPFYGTGAISNEFKLTGFIDAQGRIVSTAFRRAFEHGGVFLFDEMDASLPAALLAFNAALANDWMDFPDANVKRHPDFCVIAGANTFGTGADRQYVGRNQLDAASLDRYAVLDWDYDEALEAALVGAPAPRNAPAPASVTPLSEGEAQARSHQFLERVRKVRSAVNELKVRHVVSPRAVIHGSKLLAAGWSWSQVEDAVLWKGLDKDARSKVIAKAA